MFKTQTFPTPGNHEYDTPNAAGYFQYFGAQFGSAGHAYYSYKVGDWHVVSLDSDCSSPTQCFGDGNVDPEQVAWLQSDLAAHPGVCTLAYWHHPLSTTTAPTPGSSRGMRCSPTTPTSS